MKVVCRMRHVWEGRVALAFVSSSWSEDWVAGVERGSETIVFRFDLNSDSDMVGKGYCWVFGCGGMCFNVLGCFWKSVYLRRGRWGRC